MNFRPLRRSRGNYMLGGVVGGLAKRYGFDPGLARIASIFLAPCAGVAIYLVLWLALPLED